MKKRCKDSKYIGCYSLKNYKLVFRNFYLGGGVADVQKQKKSTVLGAIYQISKSDEKKLDIYEDFPNTYIKKYFKLLGKKVIKFGVVSHLGVIVDYFSHLLVPSALRVPLSQVAGGVYMMFKGRGASSRLS